MTSKRVSSANEVERDARGQSESRHKGGSNDGVSSAKPRVITGSDDATVHKRMPGTGNGEKDWDVNYDERDRTGSDFRG